MYQGRGDAELIELSRQATSMFPRMAVWPASTALYEAYFGDPQVARVLLAEAVASRLEEVGLDTLRLVALSFYADAASRLRAADAAELTHELMSPWDDQVIWSGAQAYGHVRLWLGVAAATMGRHREADEAFAFACRFHDDNGLMLWSARSHLGWAESLADRGDMAQAQPHAARALELARLNGYGLIEALAAPIARDAAVATD
jgi:tetratricopeptide (TPR) repeat protein